MIAKLFDPSESPKFNVPMVTLPRGRAIVWFPRMLLFTLTTAPAALGKELGVQDALLLHVYNVPAAVSTQVVCAESCEAMPKPTARAVRNTA